MTYYNDSKPAEETIKCRKAVARALSLPENASTGRLIHGANSHRNAFQFTAASNNPMKTHQI
jgi:hypothetical protein